VPKALGMSSKTDMRATNTTRRCLWIRIGDLLLAEVYSAWQLWGPGETPNSFADVRLQPCVVENILVKLVIRNSSSMRGVMLTSSNLHKP
jgi:hypothetical protein